MANKGDGSGAEADLRPAQSRIKSLIHALDARHAGEPQDISNQDVVAGTLLLVVEARELASWLRFATRSVGSLRFPAARGYYTLQQARGPRTADRADGESTLLTMRGLFHEQGGGVIFFDRLIVITLTPISGGRTALQLECHQPDLAGYYRELVSSIEEKWA